MTAHETSVVANGACWSVMCADCGEIRFSVARQVNAEEIAAWHGDYDPGRRPALEWAGHYSSPVTL